MFMSKKLQSLLPFILASLGFTLIALVTTTPLFEWEISEFVTDIPSDVYVDSFWKTRLGDSLGSDLYILNQVKIVKNGNSCSPAQLFYDVRRSQIDDAVERMALTVNQGVVRWLTGLTQTGQLTMAVFLVLCGAYIWWFTISEGQPITEAIISTVIAMVLLVFLTNVWRFLGPNIGTFTCLPEIRGTVSFTAKLSKIYYGTPVILLVGILLEIGAIIVIIRQVTWTVSGQKKR